MKIIRIIEKHSNYRPDRSDDLLSFINLIVVSIEIMSKDGILFLESGRVNPIIKLFEGFTWLCGSDNSHCVFLAGIDHGPDNRWAEIQKLKARSQRLACLEEVSIGNVGVSTTIFSNIC